MAITVPATAVLLPVRISVGAHTVEAGTIALEPGDRLLPSLAEFLREAADVIERMPAEEVTDDAAPE